MTEASTSNSLEGAVAWFDEEQRNIAGLVQQLEGHEAAGAALEDLVSATALLYPIRGMWREWKALLEPAISSAERRGEKAREANYRTSLGNVFHRLGDWEQARSEIELALQIAEEHDAQIVIPPALASLAAVEKHDRRPDRAVELLQRARSLYREQENPRGEAQALGDLANNLDDLGRPQEALALHQQASAVFREIGDRYSEMREQGNAAIALLNLGRWEEAEQALRGVAETSAAIGARRDSVTALRDLALALAQQDRFDEANSAILEATELVRELESPYEEGLVMRQHAQVLARMGLADEALEKLRQIADHFQETGSPTDAAHAHLDLGGWYLNAGQLDDARRHFDEAIELSPEPQGIAVQRAKVGLGAIAVNDGNFDEALEQASSAVEVFRELDRLTDLREALRLKGTAELELGLLSEAEQTANELRALTEARGESSED